MGGKPGHSRVLTAEGRKVFKEVQGTKSPSGLGNMTAESGPWSLAAQRASVIWGKGKRSGCRSLIRVAPLQSTEVGLHRNREEKRVAAQVRGIFF